MIYFRSRYMAKCYAEHNKIEDYTILRKQKKGMQVFILYIPYENVSRETLRKAGKHE